MSTSTSGSTTVTVTTDQPTTVPPDPSTTSSSDSTGDESSTGTDGCAQPEDVVAMVRLDNGGASGPSTLMCTVEDVTEAGEQQHDIALDCGAVNHRLRVTTPMAPSVPIGADVVLDVHFTERGYSNNLVVRLTTADGGLILAGATSDAMPGEGEIAEDFFAPLEVAEMSDLCEIQKLPGKDFIGSCYDLEREAIVFTFADDEVAVLDHSRGQLAVSWEAAVEFAERRHETHCGDPGRWLQWVVYQPIPK